MSDDRGMLPNRFEVKRDAETLEAVQITFANEREIQRVIISRSQVAPFVEYLLQQAEVELSPPMNPSELDAGGKIEPKGHELRWGPDGNAILTVHLRTDGGGRSLPISLSAKEARELGQALSWEPDS